VPDRLPLSALLSHALIAFTIELDNEFERRMPHRTQDYGKSTESGPTPWLGSSAAVETGWQERGARLRSALQALDPALLLAGTAAPEGGWRNLVRGPGCLPHYPLVTPRRLPGRELRCS
jgi:hypothetical protein